MCIFEIFLNSEKKKTVKKDGSKRIGNRDRDNSLENVVLSRNRPMKQVALWGCGLGGITVCL